MIFIRKATLQDAKQIQIIHETSLGYPFSLEATQNQLKAVLDKGEDIVLVAEMDGKVVGIIHAQYYLAIYHEEVFNVLGLAVANECHGKGVGKALMSELEKQVIAKGVKGIRLNSGEKRKEAHLFYESIGFTKEKYQAKFIKELN
ncbi:MAG: GNAT family N-acetyltransferase [Streptococcaceae bacterium]|jgi:ribosomal protein S18 acetylase RimI-like enzyme|nr:GNAT family N-acetyltransferase [Streptococcaceae bacterium]